MESPKVSATFIQRYQNSKTRFLVFVVFAVFVLLRYLVQFQVLADYIVAFITFSPFVLTFFFFIWMYFKDRKDHVFYAALNEHQVFLKLFFKLSFSMLVLFIVFFPSTWKPFFLTAMFIPHLFSNLGMDSFFLLLSYAGIITIALFLIFYFIRLYQKGIGTYQASFSQLTKKLLYSVFFIFLFLFVFSILVFPQAYRPITDFTEDVLASLMGNETGSFSFFQNFSRAVKDTKDNLASRISASNSDLVSNISKNKDTLVKSLTDTADSLSAEIKTKLSTSGGDMTGDLTIKNANLVVEGKATTQDVLPAKDLSYNLGESGKSWNTLYIHRLIGSSPIFIGEGNSSHGLDSTGDLVISKALEVNGIIYAGDSIIPDSSSVDLGSTSKHFGTLYVDNIVGVDLNFLPLAGGTLTGLLALPSNGLTVGTDQLIVTGGNVGIGTGSPDYALDVNGTAWLRGAAAGTSGLFVKSDGNVGIGTMSPGVSLEVAGHIRTTSAGAFYSQGVNGYVFGASASEGEQIYRAGNDIKIMAGGSDRLTVDGDAGYVGIGTTNPTTLLHISKTTGVANTTIESIDGSSARLTLKSGATTGGVYYSYDATHGLSLLANDATRVFIKSDGNVGIGTTNPGTQLQLYGNNKAIQLVSASDPAYRTTIENNYSWANAMNIKGHDDAVILGTYTSNTALMYGKVGIGTTSPGSKLSVNGGISVGTYYGTAAPENGLIISGNVGIGTANPSTKLSIQGTATGDVLDFLTLANTSYAGGGRILMNNGYGNLTAIKYNIKGPDSDANDGYLTFQTAINSVLSDKMVIDNLGNVGIGTTNPSQKLHVAGTGDTRINIEAGGTSDAVMQFTKGAGTGATWGIGLDYSSSNALAIGYLSNGNPSLTANNLVTILTSGNVGIGTTSPQKKLEINDADSNTTTSGLRFTNFACTGDDKLTVGAGGDLICGTDQTGGGAGNVVDTLAATLGAANDANALDINNIGKLYAALGTVGVPAYSFQSDSDTGLWSSVANTLNFSTNGAEGMRIGSTGNVGIGTTNPYRQLSLYNSNLLGLARITQNSSATVAKTALQVVTAHAMGSALDVGQWNNAGADNWIFRAYSNVGRFDTDEVSGGASVFRFGINAAGNVGIGTASPSTKLSVTSTADEDVITVTDSDGTCTLNPESSGDWYCTSDKRLKENIVNMSSSLAKIMGLRPVSFEMKAGGDTNYGFIAQEVQEVIPEAVSTLPGGYLGVAEGKFTPYLVGAIQELSSTQDKQQTAITGITDNQNKIVEQLTDQLADQTLTTDQKITLIGKNLDDLSTEQIKTIKDKISSANNDISDISDRVTTLEDQMKKIQLQNSEEGMGLFETRLGNLEIALNVDGSDVSILGNLSVVGNVDLLNGKLTAKDIEVLGTMKAKDVEAQDSLKGDNLSLGENARGTDKIEAGDTEVKIQTPEVSEDAQIYITPKGSTSGKMLYFDDIVEGKSFKVKIDKPAIDDDINFTWLIIK